MVVEVFITNVQRANEAKTIVETLAKHFPNHQINFDLTDCDKILCVAGKEVKPESIITNMQRLNYQCTVLE